MPAYSATSVQKTLKEDVTSLFARITGGAASNPTIVTTDGLSKGIASAVRTGTGAYTITLDSNFPVWAYLGSIIAITIEGPGNTVLGYRISSVSAAARTISIVTLDSTGAVVDVPTNQTLNCTITYTPSQVW